MIVFYEPNEKNRVGESINTMCKSMLVANDKPHYIPQRQSRGRTSLPAVTYVRDGVLSHC